MVKALGKRIRGALEHGAPASATGHSLSILFLTPVNIDLSRFEIHFKLLCLGSEKRELCLGSVWVTN